MGTDIPASHTGGSPSDEELLTAARRGDAAALETLLLRYQPHLFRFGLRMCGNVEDAGEIAQQSLISMAGSIREFRGESSVSSWLYTIARRFCMKRRRRSKFAPVQEESLDAPTSEAARQLADARPNPEQAAMGSEFARMLTRAIDALDPAQREVLLLRDVEGLSAPEVAGITGISIDAVKSRLHRARVAVREELAPLLGQPAAVPPRATACPDVLTLFSQHLEGEIDSSVCAAMEAHLARCGSCRSACESLKRTLALCRQLPTPDVPPSVAASVKAAIHDFLEQR
jgi:RNA polymerase sigma-70 factor (ECF subfamily)